MREVRILRMSLDEYLALLGGISENSKDINDIDDLRDVLEDNGYDNWCYDITLEGELDEAIINNETLAFIKELNVVADFERSE